MFHDAEMFKQMFLHTALLTRMPFIINFIVVPFIPKVVSCFPNILFSTTLTGKKINQTVIVTVEFVIYVFLVTLVVKMFVSETFSHTSHLFLPRLVDPSTLYLTDIT